MQQNPDAIREAMRLAATPQGQQLIALLNKNGGAQLHNAAQLAAGGDMTLAKTLLKDLLQDPRARQLMEQLGGNYGPAGR